MAGFFGDDAEFINVTGLWWHSRKAIQKAPAYGLSTIFNQSTLRLLCTKVKYLGENIAVVQAKMRLTGQSPVGDVEVPGQRDTLFTFVVHQTGAQWSCASAQNTDIIPHMETHVRDEQGTLRPVDYRKGKDTNM